LWRQIERIRRVGEVCLAVFDKEENDSEFAKKTYFHYQEFILIEAWVSMKLTLQLQGIAKLLPPFKRNFHLMTGKRFYPKR